MISIGADFTKLYVKITTFFKMHTQWQIQEGVFQAFHRIFLVMRFKITSYVS